MQSLQADQSPYNRKGVCYIVVFSVCCRYSSRYGEIIKCKNTTKSLILRTNFSFIFEQNIKNKTPESDFRTSNRKNEGES